METVGPEFNKAEAIEEGKRLGARPRPDDCFGVGGTFCITNEAASARIGLDKVHGHLLHGAE